MSTRIKNEKILSGKVSPVSGFPIEWVNKYSKDGEYLCIYCEHNHTDLCWECNDYGTLFEPKENIV